MTYINCEKITWSVLLGLVAGGAIISPGQRHRDTQARSHVCGQRGRFWAWSLGGQSYHRARGAQIPMPEFVFLVKMSRVTHWYLDFHWYLYTNYDIKSSKPRKSHKIAPNEYFLSTKNNYGGKRCVCVTEWAVFSYRCYFVVNNQAMFRVSTNLKLLVEDASSCRIRSVLCLFCTEPNTTDTILHPLRCPLIGRLPPRAVTNA